MSSQPTESDVAKAVGRPAAKGFRRFAFYGVGALAVAAVIGLLVAKPWAAPDPGPKWITTDVARQDLAATVSATGTLRGKDTVSVGAETSGRLLAVHVDFNDAVVAGQLLAEIDPSTTEAALAQARAQLLQARANLRTARATEHEASAALARTRALLGEQLASAQALEQVEAAQERAAAGVQSAQAQVALASAQVDSQRTALAKTKVLSPIDGVVLSRAVEVGQTVVAAMSTPELFSLARDLREMEVTIAIDEADVGRTRVGQVARFTVDAWPARTFEGELRAIHNVAVIRDNVVTYEGRVAFRNEDLLLRPGMTASVTLEIDARQNVFVVPNAALRFIPPETEQRAAFLGPRPERTGTENPDPAVYVLRDNKPVRIVVEQGLTDGTLTEVSASGLREGDKVITDTEAEPEQ